MATKAGSKACSGPPDTLALVVDLPPTLLTLPGGAHHYLNCLAAFANLHLSASVSRRLCVVAASQHATRFLYPDTTVDHQKTRQKDGRLEQLLSLDESLEKNIKKMVAEAEDKEDTADSPTLLSGAMARALLFLRRHVEARAAEGGAGARMLVVKVGDSSVGQYLQLINIYLTAQKLGVPLDVCVVGGACGLLQQGADITGGYYHRVSEHINHRDPRGAMRGWRQELGAGLREDS